jgi:hypothetical protein
MRVLQWLATVSFMLALKDYGVLLDPHSLDIIGLHG